MGRLTLFFIIALLFILTGCAHLERSRILEGTTSGTDNEKFYHINAGNSGIYVFTFPIITGDPFGYGPKFFTNNVSTRSVTEMIVKDASIHNGKVMISSVVSQRSSGLISFVFQTFFTWRFAQVSANVVVPDISSH
jgi:hypothetical protein